MIDLFGPRPRRPRRVMMHVADAGIEMARYECAKCGHKTDWEPIESVTEVKRGKPCPMCNERPNA